MMHLSRYTLLTGGSAVKVTTAAQLSSHSPFYAFGLSSRSCADFRAESLPHQRPIPWIEQEMALITPGKGPLSEIERCRLGP